MKMQTLKAQSSVEFLIVAGLAFIAAIFFVGISAFEVKELRDQKEFFLIKDLALKLQKEIFIVASVENGYERTFFLPSKLENNIGYVIVTTNNTITVGSSKTEFFVEIPFVKGNFTVGSNKIEKVNGEIFINR